MPIFVTGKFWNYISAEPENIINKCKNILTRKDYDFDTKSYNTSIYYQEISKFTIDGLDYITLRFPAGLTKWVLKNVSISLESNIEKISFSREKILEKAYEIQKINPKYEVRDYQIDAVKVSLENYTSLITAGTGSGKTSILCLLTQMIPNDKILIMNGNNFILQQIYDRLISFGETDISWNPSKEPDYTKRIVLLNTKGSDSRLNLQDKNYINFLQSVNTWLTDEGHHFKSLTSFEPLFYMNEENLHHIVGYTASPFREYKNPYSNSEDFRLIALLGEPLFTYDLKSSIDDKNIAQPYGYFINFPNKKAFIPKQFEDNYYMQYRMNITYNKTRNKAGLEMIKFLDKHNIKTLVSIVNIKPGQKLLQEIIEAGIKALFIVGDETIYEYELTKRNKLKLVERSGNTDDIKNALNNGYNIILGSSVVDEGVDIDLFQASVLFSAGKTPIAGLQRLGRSARKKVNGMNVSFVIDFKDINGHPTFQSHYMQRRQLMEDSGVKILNNVHDFIELVEQVEKAKET